MILREARLKIELGSDARSVVTDAFNEVERGGRLEKGGEVGDTTPFPPCLSVINALLPSSWLCVGVSTTLVA